ncbi:MAG: hypothetical protein ACT4O9_03335 [Blastocatellia bacterium]
MIAGNAGDPPARSRKRSPISDNQPFFEHGAFDAGKSPAFQS